MDDRFNTIAGWTLFAGIVALGLGSISSHYFRADKSHRPETMGYAIQGVVEEGAGGAKADEPIEARLAKADPAKGEATFKKCMACHTIAQGAANGIGPNLWGVVGDKVAEGRGGFAFSDALKKVGGTWDWGKLDPWLKSPSTFAPGTKMTFAGLPDAQDRANVIAYLNTQGSNKPLPAAPAAAAAPAAGAAKGAAAPAGAATGAAPAGGAAPAPSGSAAAASKH